MRDAALAGRYAGDSPPLTIGAVMLALGDSIAAGIGAGHASEGCMALLAARLRALAPGLRLLNLSVPGETSETILEPGGQLELALQAVSDAAAAGECVGPVTLSIGGNDAMEAALYGDGEALRRLRRGLYTILERLASALDRAGQRLGDVACVQTVYNPFEALDGGMRGAQADLLAPRRAGRGDFNRVIRTAAASFDVRVAEVARAFSGRAGILTWIGSGDIHPSGAGHEAIAGAYLDAGGWERG